MIPMKRRNSAATLIVCLSLFAFFFLFEINLSSIFRLIATRSTGIQESERLELKPMRPQEPLIKAIGKEALPPQQSPPRRQIISCDRSHREYDLCSINGQTVVDPNTSTFFLMDPTTSSPQSTVEKIKPYPRKWENFPMARIKELTITSSPSGPRCKVRHKAPAIVFSAAGYTGNVFHDFNDGFIPLFITANSIYQNQDVILVVSKARDWWVSKYRNLLDVFSTHKIVSLDNDTSTHCFPSATLGLISYGFMALMPNSSQTLLHFRALLDQALGHGKNNPYSISNEFPKFSRRPRLVFINRLIGQGREILNKDGAKRVAEEIGFDVISFEPTVKTSLDQVYALLNSSHAMVGIHGAALTHFLFLRPGSVLVQVMPLGTNWAGKMCHGEPARAMGIEYMEYKIDVEESSLVEKYDKDDMMIKDPAGLQGKKWSFDVMKIYLKEQNVKLDLVRFRECLKEAYRKAKVFMEKEG
ncbi:protein O-linked-mannose beta-1,4-N-acetylglucosaminyltransferase 2-like [Herrania umbratica]|uniref:Protein O-linked-mannose beta-1,4-N-acetylglucosaminyltransferase 2-like n=1 Tax=Herrania umbratica TaxID=108875 RepID=A0A6J1BJX1_9ROSI|nr:protein O-linked-mannose beta-1,4-N-acetylglucosaminyltransferase 2-like [Herrania umbratica]